MNHDRNFDDIAQKFVKNIYESTKGDIRQTILLEDIENILLFHTLKDKNLTVLDAGGGLAQISQRIASKGHQVILCDISKNMLDGARELIDSNGLSSQFRYVHSPVQKIQAHLTAKVDLLLFHAVMEWLEQPLDALKILLKQVKSDGVISLMFYNHHGLLFKNAICGNIPHVLNGMPHKKRFKMQPFNAFMPDEIYQLLEHEGFEIIGKSGIRSFSDYIGNKGNMGEFTPDDLAKLERLYCRTEPYISLGRYIHVWAKNSK